MFNIDLDKDVQLLDGGLLLVSFSKELYTTWFGSVRTNQLDEALHSSCGAMASPFIKEFLQEVAPEDYRDMSGFLAGFGLDISDIRGTMWYHKSLYEKISTESKLSIIEHERAHLVLGHLEDIIEESGGILQLIRTFKETGTLPIMDSPERELEADAYSADLLGKSSMKRALYEISGIPEVHEFIRGLYPDMELSNEVINDKLLEKLKYRLDALI